MRDRRHAVPGRADGMDVTECTGPARDGPAARTGCYTIDTLAARKLAEGVRNEERNTPAGTMGSYRPGVMAVVRTGGYSVRIGALARRALARCASFAASAGRLVCCSSSA